VYLSPEIAGFFVNDRMSSPTNWTNVEEMEQLTSREREVLRLIAEIRCERAGYANP
jgi:DNA-binding NarL/FixJ family response regulator